MMERRDLVHIVKYAPLVIPVTVLVTTSSNTTTAATSQTLQVNFPSHKAHRTALISVSLDGLEVCMGVGNAMGIPFPWESHGNGNSHTAHDGNGNGNKANGNGNSIYFTRVKIPKIIVMH